MKMPALRTISNFSDSHADLPADQKGPEAHERRLEQADGGHAADTDRFAVAHADAAVLPPAPPPHRPSAMR
jgi:hypothetical protein